VWAVMKRTDSRECRSCHLFENMNFEEQERVAARRLPVLVITGHDQPGNAERVRALGGLGYFLKPVKETPLLDAIRAAIEHPLVLSAPAG